MRVLAAMSGGVDSSVAAARLAEAGHDVTGVTLKVWGGPQDSGCCSVSDVEDARRVAAQLGLPHYVFNLTDEFAADVVEPYVEAHAAGATPNPCVECNRSIKFGRLLERAELMGFDAVATGHHARVTRDGDRFRLRRGVDAAKDQSYVLYMLGQRELARSVFPVGESTKDEVRAEAAALGLRTAAKPESMDVCFVTSGDRESFLARRGAMRSGEIVDVDAGRVGRHDGHAAFTVGQRRGLDVALGERRYVLGVDAETATVTIGRRDDLLADRVAVRVWCFVDGPPPPDETLTVQARAHGIVGRGRLESAPGSDAGPSARDSVDAGGSATVRLDEAAPRVAPGQVVALYRGDELVGGGLAE